MVQAQYCGVGRVPKARLRYTDSLTNEYSRDKRVPRERIGRDFVRWPARRGGRRRAIQSCEIRGGIPCRSNPVLPQRGGAYACECRSCGGATKSLRADVDETVLCGADAIVRARAIEGAGEIHRDTRSAGCGA